MAYVNNDNIYFENDINYLQQETRSLDSCCYYTIVMKDLCFYTLTLFLLCIIECSILDFLVPFKIQCST